MRKTGSLLLTTILTLLSTIFLGSTNPIDPVLVQAAQYTEKLFAQIPNDLGGDVQAIYLKGLDGEKDYILAIRNTLGYAIFEKDSMEIIEYSNINPSPYADVKYNDFYFAGPANYYKEDGIDSISNIKTKETLKKSQAALIATSIKQKLNTDRLERESLEKQKKEEVVTSNKLYMPNNTIRNLLIPGVVEGEVVDADSFTVLSRHLVSDYKFFELTNHGENEGDQCVSVAVQLLLAYNNWSKDGRIIIRSDFLLPGRELFVLQPYHQTRTETTSTVADDDFVITFYEQILRYVDTAGAGEFMWQAYRGIEQYLDEHTEGLYDPTSLDSQDWFSWGQENVQTVLRGEINNNRPAIASMVYYDQNSIIPGGHAVVIYGYQTIRMGQSNVNGFIAHYGWGPNYSASWVNESWVNGFVRFASGHTHTDTVIGGNGHIVQCTVCRRSAYTGAHNYQKVNIGNQYYHKLLCECQYEELMAHSLVYTYYDTQYDLVTCECGFFQYKEHFYKNGNVCFYCGYHN